jgi:hypothetical protein
LPISAGSKGGVLGTHPLIALTLGFLGHPNAKTLGQACSDLNGKAAEGAASKRRTICKMK